MARNAADDRLATLDATCHEIFGSGGLPEVLRFAVAASLLQPSSAAPAVSPDTYERARPLFAEYVSDAEVMRRIVDALADANERGGRDAALAELATLGDYVRATFELWGMSVWTGLDLARAAAMSADADDRREPTARATIGAQATRNGHTPVPVGFGPGRRRGQRTRH